MDRRSALVLLAVFGAGVFLAGLELMITAVALPSILADLVDADGTSAWVELRKASWIINGYLLVYILAMPLAGRLADLWGARRLFLAALACSRRSARWPGMAQDLDQLIAARLVQAVGGGILVPVGTAAAAHLFGGAARPRALGVIGALTFLGMAAGPFLGAAILSTVHPEGALAAAGLAGSTLAERRRSGLALDLLRQRADRPRRRWSSPGPPARAGTRRGAPAGWTSWAPPCSASRWRPGCIGPDAPRRDDAWRARTSTRPRCRRASAWWRSSPRSWPSPAACRRATRSSTSGCSGAAPFSAAALVSLLTGYAFATAIIGGAVFVDRVLYGGPDEQRLALGSLAAATAVGALVSGFAVRFASYRVVTLVGLALSVGRPRRDGGLGSGDRHPRSPRSRSASSGSGSACRSRRARRPRSKRPAGPRSGPPRRS